MSPPHAERGIIEAVTAEGGLGKRQNETVRESLERQNERGIDR